MKQSLPNRIITIILFFFFIQANAFALESKLDDDEFADFDKQFGTSQDEEYYDPFEKVNRKIFVVNDVLDRNIFEPVARAYGNYIPKPVRKALRNVTSNLTLPISAINSFAQGKVDNGLATFSNFLINSTVGLAGIFDVAGSKEIKYEQEDFGQTFGHYGIPQGPYLMLPVFGPSTLRDASGSALTLAIDPMGFNEAKIGGSQNVVDSELRITKTLISSVDLRQDLLKVTDDLRKDSFDFYATIRSAYIQNRNSKIKK